MERSTRITRHAPHTHTLSNSNTHLLIRLHLNQQQLSLSIWIKTAHKTLTRPSTTRAPVYNFFPSRKMSSEKNKNKKKLLTNGQLGKKFLAELNKKANFFSRRWRIGSAREWMVRQRWSRTSRRLQRRKRRTKGFGMRCTASLGWWLHSSGRRRRWIAVGVDGGHTHHTHTRTHTHVHTRLSERERKQGIKANFSRVGKKMEILLLSICLYRRKKRKRITLDKLNQFLYCQCTQKIDRPVDILTLCFYCCWFIERFSGVSNMFLLSFFFLWRIRLHDDSIWMSTTGFVSFHLMKTRKHRRLFKEKRARRCVDRKFMITRCFRDFVCLACSFRLLRICFLLNIFRKRERKKKEVSFMAQSFRLTKLTDNEIADPIWNHSICHLTIFVDEKKATRIL